MKQSNNLVCFAAALATVSLLGCGNGSPDPATDTTADEAPPAASAPTSGDAPASDASEVAAGLLDPNEAAPEDLLALPHFDETLADALTTGRPYEDMLAVDTVLAEQLSDTQREDVYGQLFKRLDLNAATEAEILLIPGVGDRMAHEFEEYRPYRGIEQFRREIGKYVDETEVARLEQYVRIPPGG